MRDMKIFHGLSKEGIEFFEKKLQEKIFKNGEIICTRGEPAKEIFFIENGIVEVILNDVKISELNSGEIFGEMGLIDMMKRSATVRALGTVVIKYIETKAFYELYKTDIKDYTIIIMNIARELSRRLRETDEKLATLTPANI